MQVDFNYNQTNEDLLDNYSCFWQKHHIKSFSNVENFFQIQMKLEEKTLTELENIVQEDKIEISEIINESKLEISTNKSDKDLKLDENFSQIPTAEASHESLSQKKKTYFEAEHGFEGEIKNVVIEMIRKSFRLVGEFLYEYFLANFNIKIKKFPKEKMEDYSVKKWKFIKENKVSILDFILGLYEDDEQKYSENKEIYKKIFMDDRHLEVQTILSTRVEHFFEIIKDGAECFFTGKKRKENGPLLKYLLYKRNNWSQGKGRKVSNSDFEKIFNVFWIFIESKNQRKERKKKKVNRLFINKK